MRIRNGTEFAIQIGGGKYIRATEELDVDDAVGKQLIKMYGDIVRVDDEKKEQTKEEPSRKPEKSTPVQQDKKPADKAGDSSPARDADGEQQEPLL